MRSRPCLAALAGALLALLSGCVKNRETLAITADGHVTCTIEVDGNPDDLVDGYPLPDTPGWTFGGQDLERWLVAGHPPRRDTCDPKRWVNAEGARLGNMKLSATAGFDSVASLPVLYAPPGDAYAETALARATSFRTEKRGTRTLHFFERRYAPRANRVHHVWSERFEKNDRIKRIGQSVAKGEPIAPEDLRTAVTTLQEAFRESMAIFTQEAVGALYERGSATLPAEGAKRVRESVRSAIAYATDDESIRELIRVLLPDGNHIVVDVTPGLKEPGPMELFEGKLRDTLRTTLARALEHEEVAAEERHGVLYQLESGFTEYDRTVDLGDEEFELSVTMPGTVVAGNFTAARGGTATFAFKGDQLRGQELVLRAVSVVE